jgi:hypothetical protein
MRCDASGESMSQGKKGQRERGREGLWNSAASLCECGEYLRVRHAAHGWLYYAREGEQIGVIMATIGSRENACA